MWKCVSGDQSEYPAASSVLERLAVSVQSTLRIQTRDKAFCLGLSEMLCIAARTHATQSGMKADLQHVNVAFLGGKVGGCVTPKVGCVGVGTLAEEEVNELQAAILSCDMERGGARVGKGRLADLVDSCTAGEVAGDSAEVASMDGFVQIGHLYRL